MKISVKITLMSAISIVALIVTVGQGYNGIHSISEMFTYCGDVPITNNQAASDIVTDLRHITSLNALYYCYKGNDAKIHEINEKINTLSAGIQKNLVIIKKNASEKGMQMINDFEQKLATSGASRLKLNEFVAAGRWDDYLSYRIGAYENTIDATVDAMEKYKDFAADVALKYCYVTSTEASESIAVTLITVAAVVVVVLTILSIIIITGITRPLKRAVTAANHVSEGNMDVDLETNSKDEIGTLMHSLEIMVKAINSLINDTNSLSSSIIAGQLEVRVDASKHKGAFRELIMGIDKTVDAVIGPLNMTAEYIDRISKGDIPPEITDTYYGDFNEIKNNLNNCIETIGSLVKEINASINEATNGNLHYRADASKFQGDYSKIMTGVNSLVEAFVEPIRTTAKFLQDVANGDEGIQKMTNDYKGEFNEIKQSVNTLHDTLFLILGEIIGTAEEAQKGNLDKKADSSKVKGAWNKILSSLNDLTVAAGAIMNDAGLTLSVMATGDLTPRITKDYPGKFGEMKNNINNLGNSLTDLISQLSEAIHTTAAASAQISATAETIAAATQEQSSQTDEVAGAVEEMARTVTDNARSATKTASLAKQSGEVANSGGKVVEQTVAKMREISTVVKSSAENIAKLGESSKKIGEIISVIDDIADQTNLLSLNAAIEAARAGEQGRGFAVVADSVGKLAVSTASATKEIADMIKGIQMDTEGAVRAMEKGTAEVQSGIELADSAGHSIKDILTGINELLNMINQIAAASDQQSATSEEISKNVSSISRVTADSARNIEDVASTANDLAKMTDTLTSLVSQFKITDTHSRSYSHSLSDKSSNSNDLDDEE